MVKVVPFERFILYLTIIAGFVGSAFLVVEVGVIHLFPYRILLPFIWVLFAIDVLLNNGHLNISHIKVRIYLQFLVIWFFYAVLSLVWAASKESAIREIIILFMAISVIFFVVYYFNSLRYLKQFYYLWLSSIVVLLPLGIWETVTGSHLTVSVLAQSLDPRIRFMPTTVFYNTNDFATYLALTLPFVLTWIRYSEGLVRRLSGVLVLIGSFYLLIITASRINYLAVLASGGFWFLFLLKSKQKIKVVILICLVVLVLFTAFPNRMESIFTFIGVQMNSLGSLSQISPSSISIRLNLIRNATGLFIETYGFGVGAGNIEHYLEYLGRYTTFGVTNVHNWWIEILVNYGIFIFIGYLIFYGNLLINLIKVYKDLKDGGEKMIGEALLVSLVSFLFASISSSSIMAMRVQWMLFAFALAFLNYMRIKKQEYRMEMSIASSD